MGVRGVRARGARGLVFALLLVACEQSEAPPVRSAASIEAEHTARRDAALADLQAVTWAPSCDGHADSSRCGLLIDELRGARMKTFVREACGEDAEQEISDDCRKQFLKAYFQQLPKRYPSARAADVDRFCSSHPDDCKTLVGLELAWVMAHNIAVHAAYSARTDLIDDEQANEQTAATKAREQHAEEPAAWQRVFRAIGTGLGRFGEGLSPSTSAVRTGNASSGNDPGCSSDTNCGYGRHCVKAQFESSGTCADVVNAAGVRIYARPRSDSAAPGKGDGCMFDTQCPVGFHCIKGSSLHGNCMK